MLSTKTHGTGRVISSAYSSTRNTAIVGMNHIGATVYMRGMYGAPETHKLVGMINIEPVDNTLKDMVFPERLGDISEFKNIVEAYQIHKIIVAVDPHDSQKIHEVVQLCHRYGIDYELVSDAYDVVYGAALKDIFRRVWQGQSLRPGRLLELAAALILLVLFLPVWAVIALLIKLDSPGSVLCSQERVGKDGKLFRAYRFRTMRVADNSGQDLPATVRRDALLTRVGKLLKRSRLEELPLLLNVIVGDMSFIGPNAERPYYYQKYRREVPFYENRVKVKPGIIGYAQVELHRHEPVENIREELRYDFFYVDHRTSFKLNLKIILKAFLNLFRAKA